MGTRRLYCNFCQIHKSLRVTPAMESGIADHTLVHRGTLGEMMTLSVIFLTVLEPHSQGNTPL